MRGSSDPSPTVKSGFPLKKAEVKKIFEAADNALKPGEVADWVNQAALFRRAYYLGLICGLTPFANEEDISSCAVSKLIESAFSSSNLDDAIQSHLNGGCKAT